MELIGHQSPQQLGITVKKRLLEAHMNSQDSTGPTVPPSAGNPQPNPAAPPPAYRPPESLSAFGFILSFLRRSATHFMMAGTAILVLLLLIPLSMVRSVLQERLGRRNEAVANITSSWGREQKLVGPVLIVPYRYTVKSGKEKPVAEGKTERVEVVDTASAKAYFLPATLRSRATSSRRNSGAGFMRRWCTAENSNSPGIPNTMREIASGGRTPPSQ